MSDKRGIRWMPLWILLALGSLALIWIWFIMDASSRQMRVMNTMMAVILFGLLSLLWILLFSRMTWRQRLLGFGIWLLFPIIGLGVFEIRDVSGDVVPLVAFRWSPTADEKLGDLPGGGSIAIDESTVLEPIFPRFLGPNGNGIVDGPLLADDWDQRQPQEVWRRNIGAAWSAFAVAGNLAVTQEQRGEDELVSCYLLDSGEPVWATGVATRYETTLGGVGPRATPAVDGNRVYAMGAKGHIICLNLINGDILWQKHAIKDFGGQPPEWGFSSSPLVDGNKVIVVVGNADGAMLVALNKEDGSEIWRGGNDRPGYSTPRIATVAGKRQVLTLNFKSVTGIDPETGGVIWRQDWNENAPNVADPVAISEDQVLVSSGYGFGAKLFKLTPGGETLNAEEIYRTPRLKAKFANFVTFDGYVYGLDDGILTCINPVDGQRVWKRGRYGHGQILLVGDRLLVQSEQGKLFLIRPNPEELTILGSLEVLDGKAWNTLAIAGDLLLMRNHKQAVALRLPTR